MALWFWISFLVYGCWCFHVEGCYFALWATFMDLGSTVFGSMEILLVCVTALVVELASLMLLASARLVSVTPTPSSSCECSEFKEFLLDLVETSPLFSLSATFVNNQKCLWADGLCLVMAVSEEFHWVTLMAAQLEELLGFFFYWVGLLYGWWIGFFFL